MGWDAILKAGKKAIVTAAKKSDQAVTPAGKSAGHAVLHPSQTLRGAGQAVKTAAIGGAVGYVGWEKLTSDKSVARIVSDAVVGESVTNAIAGTADGVRELKDKAGEAIEHVGGPASAPNWTGRRTSCGKPPAAALRRCWAASSATSAAATCRV